MRTVLLIAGLYSVLLFVYIKVQEQRVNQTINSLFSAEIQRLIAMRPIDHRYTLFSKILVEPLEVNFPYALHNQSVATSYELVTMSPCNPRIQSCS